jgi:hypothetical protein
MCGRNGSSNAALRAQTVTRKVRSTAAQVYVARHGSDVVREGAHLHFGKPLISDTSCDAPLQLRGR